MVAIFFRYEDFFRGIKKKGLNKNGIVGKRKRSSNAIDFVDGLESTDMDIEENDDKVTKYRCYAFLLRDH